MKVVRVFKNKPFHRFAKNRISDKDLCQAVLMIADGRIDADLGAGVIKQRVARTGKGKSGGFRTIIAFQSSARAVFIHGFAKSDKENISRVELQALKKLAGILLTITDVEIAKLVNNSDLIEVICSHEKKVSK